uniref:Uncharacterized protein n=1 Tax=Lepeophtheirus salmonis TaxID=72036 RepID=A0A0K2V1I2_LEPSM
MFVILCHLWGFIVDMVERFNHRTKGKKRKKNNRVTINYA